VEVCIAPCPALVHADAAIAATTVAVIRVICKGVITSLSLPLGLEPGR